MRWMNVLVPVGTAAVLSAGCAGSDAPPAKPSATPLPNVVPSPTGPAALGDVKPSPSPGKNASLAENLQYELRIKTIKMAYAMGRTSAECDENVRPEPGTKATCTVTYEGVRVPWNVTIGGRGFSPGLIEYTAEPAMGVITREGAIRFYWANKAFGRQVRCSDMPAVELVPLDKPTRYQCGTSPRVKESLQATDAGPRFYQYSPN
ncbi:hypothetical protein ACFYYL_25685 [Actinomadura geliboluensis]|uniref:hypothetical protein n=1 Tax=Actinomadura geliboluensis TaxID=882440 RepID=UPI00369CDFFB